MTGLIYIGKGAFVPNPCYPARDLTAEEVTAFGKEALLKTGLYEESKKQNAESRTQKADEKPTVKKESE